MRRRPFIGGGAARAGGLAAVVALAAVVLALTGIARAQSFIQALPADPCDRARSYASDDESPAALQAHRACRLAMFENRLAAERAQRVAAEVEMRDQLVQSWAAATQPIRVVRPMAVEGFVGTGIASYGLAFSWSMLRQIEAGAWLGWKTINAYDRWTEYGSPAYLSRSIGLRGRAFLSPSDSSLFVGSGLTLTRSGDASMWVASAAPEPALPGGGAFEQLHANVSADSLNASVGYQIATHSVRLSLEYTYEYVFYTGASLHDTTKTPHEQLRIAWARSLLEDRHGVRLQVGYAF